MQHFLMAKEGGVGVGGGVQREGAFFELFSFKILFSSSLFYSFALYNSRIVPIQQLEGLYKSNGLDLTCTV